MTMPTRTEFIEFHRPALASGTYDVTMTQTIATTDGRIPTTTYAVNRRFLVAGERHTLPPSAIQAVFPPAGSLGDHANVLPHIILNHSTLPWQRHIESSDTNTPWLALLIFTEDETQTISTQVTTLGALQAATTNAPYWPGLTLEKGETATDRLNVVDIPRLLLHRLLPTPSDLTYLTHVRQATDEADQAVGEETAVVLANRLPARGTTTVVHLVSLTDRFSEGVFNYQAAGDDDLIRLVTLHNWHFTNTDPAQTFVGLLTGLNNTPGLLHLPLTNNATADQFLQQGYLPLKHFGRQGDRTISWYRGPLRPGHEAQPHEPLIGHIKTADELVRYHPNVGLFDVSYAAAWELGRLLALQSQSFSTALYQWKRSHAQQRYQVEQHLLHPHLPMQGAAASSIPLPNDITTWFERLSLLEGVPFNYILPDERLLPPESIRFFILDPIWVDCLLDGAFAIGRVTTADHHRDMQMAQVAANPHTTVSGFLIRSDLISGWPRLLINGYDQIINDTHFESAHTPLTLLRMDRLSPNILLCLFAGELQTVDIHQLPQMLHFGLDAPDADHATHFKQLRDEQGELTGVEISPLPWRDQSHQLLDVTALAQRIQTQTQSLPFTPAQFALEMVEGVTKVRFKKSTVGG